MSIATRLLRFVFMALAASFGLFGIVVLMIYLVLHLCHLQSFGVPYMAPFAPFNLADQKDNLFRAPWWKMVFRPQSYAAANPHRQTAASGQARHSAGPEGESATAEEN